MNTEQRGRRAGPAPGEPLVTLAGPFDPAQADALDLATGLRFRNGKAAGVPEPVARELAENRRGYYVEPNGRD